MPYKDEENSSLLNKKLSLLPTTRVLFVRTYVIYPIPVSFSQSMLDNSGNTQDRLLAGRKIDQLSVRLSRKPWGSHSNPTISCPAPRNKTGKPEQGKTLTVRFIMLCGLPRDTAPRSSVCLIHHVSRSMPTACTSRMRQPRVERLTAWSLNRSDMQEP